MEKMTDSRKIVPCKIYVRYIPEQTTADELKLFFSTCGNVTGVNIIPPKNNHLKANGYYVISFIIFETQQAADRSVGELNGKIFTNKKGFSGTITVTHCQLRPITKIPEAFREDKSPSSENYLENRQQEKNVSDQDKMELWKRFQANEEKLRQIHNDPAMEQELTDLKMKIDQLQAKKDDLESNVEALKGEINILELQLKLKELDQEQIKLKNAQ